MPDKIPDYELPDELPETFKGRKVMGLHLNYGNGGGGLYTWCGEDGRAWPIQEQYDTRKPKPATARKPAFEPNKTGVVIRDASQPTGFYGEVCGSYRELREVWKRWRAEKRAAVQAEVLPHAHGMALCGKCGHKWVAVWPLGADALACPKCESTDTDREPEPVEGTPR